jgi:alpha-1,4-digalacturonate transport system substrate-binding protein
VSRHSLVAALLLFAPAAIAPAAFAPAARAADIRIACYSDGNECPATRTLAERFMKTNPDVHVVIDEMPYKAILESLPVQLAAGNGPDIARVTDFGPLMKYFLDLRPLLKDAADWDAKFGPVLNWLRPDTADRGIYGLPTQLTVTAPIVNKTLFEQANIPLPGPKATWDEWAAVADKVAKATQTPYGMAWDRSGHRFAGAAISYGAKYFDASGKPDVIDDGFKAMASRFVKWNLDGTIDKDVWAAAGGGYRDAFEEFANGKIVLYLTGSWQTKRLQKEIGDNFEWQVAPDPCGPAACTGMPGGAVFVAFKQSRSPQAVAAFLDFLAQDKVYAEYMSMTANLPASESVRKAGVSYDLSPAANAAMAGFTAAIGTLSPVAYQLQGYPYSRSVFNPTVDRLAQVIVGQITLDQAYQRIASDVADALAAAKH